MGALLRYGLSGLTHRLVGAGGVVFPWGTLVVNVAGALAIGFLWELFERAAVSPELRLFTFIGLLGGFTTFSTFSIETFSLLRDGETKLAALNVVLSNALCIAAVFAGFGLSRYLAR